MALQGPLSTMEGTNGNYEPINGRLGGSRGTFGSGTCSEGLVEPQMSDADLRRYPCLKGLDDVRIALENVDKLCTAMIKKFKTPDGPGSSQSAVSQCSTEKMGTKNAPLATVADSVSQCSTEKTGTKNAFLATIANSVSQCSTGKTGTKNAPLAKVADTFTDKKREKFVPPAEDFIDLTREDSSCDTVTSRRPDQEVLEDAGQVQLSPLTKSIMPNGNIQLSDDKVQSSSLAKSVPIVGIIQLSDDDEDDVNEKGSPRSSYAFNAAPEAKVHDNASPEPKVDDNASPEVKVDGSGDVIDPIQLVWDYMDRIKKGVEQGASHGGVKEAVQEPIVTGGLAIGFSVKRRKVSNGDDASQHVNYQHQPIPWVHEPNELMQVELISVSRPKRGRGRPRKEDSTRKENFSQDGCRDLLEALDWPSQIIPKQQVDVAQVNAIQQVDIVQVNATQVKEKTRNKKAGKGEEGRNVQLEKKGKRKVGVEDLLEDEDDEEEEECAKPGISDPVEELKCLKKLNKEKIDYEPYVRRRYEEEEDEIDEIFMYMKTNRTTTWEPSDITTEASGKDEGVCEHKNFDFDDDVGYYCEDCGTQGIEMPTSKSSQQDKAGCSHKNYEFTDEAGIYCPDCGKVFQDIQSYYVAIDMGKASRKQGQKMQDSSDGPPRVQLNLQGSISSEDFCGVDLQLHPHFEEKMHPHQKKGFKFLTEHLLGGQQPNNEAMGCILAHAPGTGKTCTVISFIQSFLTDFPDGKPLILAPKIMLRTWENEFNHWQVQAVKIFKIGAFTCGNFRGDGGSEDDEEDDDARPVPQTKKEDRAITLQEWQASRGVLLMSYKLFTILVMNGLGENVLPGSLDYQMSQALLETTNLVILDEGHLARNDNAQITKALHAMKTKRKVVLSGTLFHNNFKELYTVLKLCRDDFMTSHPQYGKMIAELAVNEKRSSALTCPRRKSDKELMQIEQKIFTDEIGEKLERYVKDASNLDEIGPVVEKLQSLTKFVDWYPGLILKSLPGLCEYSVCLNLTELQIATVRKIPIKVNHMTRLSLITSASIHPCLVSRANEPLSEWKVGASSVDKEAQKGVKITFLLRLVALCNMAKEKVLVFCSTLAPLGYIEELFCKVMEWQSGKQILRLDGTMQDSDRQRVIVEFNEDASRSRVLLASTKACKEGITLVGASRVVVLDCPDNPSVVRQAVSRAFRIGQKKKVYVYRLVSNHPEEEAIFMRSVNKERLSQVLSDPASTIGRLEGFLQEQGAAGTEDHILKTMMTERVMAKNINVVHKYNAVG